MFNTWQAAPALLLLTGRMHSYSQHLACCPTTDMVPALKARFTDLLSKHVWNADSKKKKDKR